MSLAFREDRPEGAEGVSLAQLNALTEQATREALQRGIDPAQIVPKVRNTLGSKIKSIEIEIG